MSDKIIISRRKEDYFGGIIEAKTRIILIWVISLFMFIVIT
jgi:hypothetical protein